MFRCFGVYGVWTFWVGQPAERVKKLAKGPRGQNLPIGNQRLTTANLHDCQFFHTFCGLTDPECPNSINTEAPKHRNTALRRAYLWFIAKSTKPRTVLFPALDFRLRPSPHFCFLLSRFLLFLRLSAFPISAFLKPFCFSYGRFQLQQGRIVTEQQ